MTDISARISYDGVEQGGTQLTRLVGALERLVELQERVTRSTRSMEGAQRRARGSSDRMTEAQRRHARASRLAEEQIGATSEQTVEAGRTAGEAAGALGNLGAVAGNISPEMGALGNVIGQVGTAASALSGSLGPVGVGIAALTAGVGLLSAAMNEGATETRLMTRQLNRQLVSARRLNEAVREGAQQQRAARRETLERFQEDDVEREARAQAEIDAAEDQMRLTRRLFRERGIDAVQFEQRMAGLREERSDAEARLALARAEGDPREREARQRRLQQELQDEIRNAAEAAEERRRAGERRTREEDQLAEESRRRTLRALQSGLRRRAAFEQQIQAGINAERQKRHTEELARIDEEREKRAAAAREEIERIRRLSRIEEEAAEKQKEAAREALEERKAEFDEIAGNLTNITQAVFGAFEAAIEGEKSLGDAILETTKELLKQFGNEMIAKGIGKMLEGFAELPSPTAAPKIGGGAAMIAFGATLGGVGAAIPSPSGEAPASPTEDVPAEDRGGGGGTLILNVNQPIMAAQTHQQISRGLRREIRRDRTLSGSLRGAA